MSAEKRVIAIYGDCQAQVLHLFASAMPSLSERFTFALITNHADPGETLPPVPPEAAHAVMLWEQYNEFADAAARDAARALLPHDCAVVRFPAMLMNAFWPFRARDTRNVAEPGFPWGRYPLGDRIAEEIAALALAPQEALAAYLERSVEQMPDLASIVAFEKRVTMERDRSCDVKMAEFLFEHLRAAYQFWSHGNVSTFVYAELFRRLFACGRDVLGEMPPTLGDELEHVSAAHPPLFQIPIHPVVIERLGLRFATPATRYRYFGHEWTFEEYMTRYIALDRSW